jgi:hypothetical protein
MKKLLILAAAAALSAACHNRNEDQAGAAPDRGDTTAVTHAIDSTRTGPPGVGGRPGDATVTPDSVGVDSARVQSNGGATDTTVTSVPQDTLGPRNPNSSAYPSDTSSMQNDSTGGMSDSTQADTTSSNQ